MGGLDPQLFKRARNGDTAAKDAIFLKNQGLIWAFSRRYLGILEQDEVYQLGALGLLKSIERFDPSLGYAFSTFAAPYITGEIKRYLRDNTLIKIQRRLKDIALKAQRYSNSVLLIEGREPSLNEISKGIGVQGDDLLEALEATSPVTYLEDLGDFVSQAEGEFSHEMDIKEAMGSLVEEERKIIYDRYFCGKSQREIGRELGVSQAQVSRREKRALLGLKEFLTSKKRISS